MQEDRLVAKEFMSTHPLGVVSISRGQEAPYAASMFIISDEQLNLFFITKSDTEKYRLLQDNGNVAITITDFESQETIQAEGIAEEVMAEGGVLEEVFKKLSSMKPPGNSKWLPPIVKLHAGEFVIFQIEVRKMRYANFTDTLKNSASDVFKQII